MFKVALIVSVALLIYYILEFLTKSLLQGEDLSRYIEGLASNLEAPTLKIEIFSGAFVAWSFVCWCCSWASYQFVLKYLWKLEDSCFQVSDTFVSPKVIVVTGGSSGLGRCLVRTLLKNSKMTVIVLDKVPFHYEEADSLQDCRKDENHGDDEEMQGRLLYYPCDVSVPIQIQQVVDCLSEQVIVVRLFFFRLNILFDRLVFPMSLFRMQELNRWGLFLTFLSLKFSTFLRQIRFLFIPFCKPF